MDDRKVYIVKSKDNIGYIFKKYDNVLKSFSYGHCGFDEELLSELSYAMLKCIHNFKYDEKKFTEIFYSSVNSAEKATRFEALLNNHTLE